MKENKFQKYLIDKLYSQGAWCFNVHGHSMQKTGVADVLVVHRRWAGFLELKVGDNKTSDKQKDIAKDLIKRYFPTFVIRCRELDITGGNWEGRCIITIENFQGGVLCRPAGLDKVLDCLQALSSKGAPRVKMPKLFADDVRTCVIGDSVYFDKKAFLCIEDDGSLYRA